MPGDVGITALKQGWSKIPKGAIMEKFAVTSIAVLNMQHSSTGN